MLAEADARRVHMALGGAWADLMSASGTGVQSTASGPSRKTMFSLQSSAPAGRFAVNCTRPSLDGRQPMPAVMPIMNSFCCWTGRPENVTRASSL